MSYREALPAPHLRHLVSAYWGIAPAGKDASDVRRVLPDGCADLICELDGTEPRARWVGTMTRAMLVSVRTEQALFGIRFASGGLYPLLGVPLSALVDASVDVTDLTAMHWRPPLERWYAAPDFATRCALANDSLNAALPRLAGHDLTALLRDVSRSVELPTVAALTCQSGLGVRSLQRRFLESVGVSPRQHLRYLRFERARQMLEMRKRSTVDIALAAGYSDQAHFVREFARFAGVTPGRWR
ncbi:helix-turn-helix transcriptional regulator [Dyella sp. A6]|uniref:helix-turn-helix domain-containing protein n=1 Tax=Dyella aluminiiresistens TaxID=3069105 RepID=UPI002E7A18EF|nr:helix-turn-helix transcriptional regulator [Dyella sp. A6]